MFPRAQFCHPEIKLRTADLMLRDKCCLHLFSISSASAFELWSWTDLFWGKTEDKKWCHSCLVMTQILQWSDTKERKLCIEEGLCSFQILMWCIGSGQGVEELCPILIQMNLKLSDFQRLLLE